MLNKQEIKALIEKESLIENYMNLEKQLTPNGFDLTVAQVFSFSAAGALDFSNKERVIPETKEILPEKQNPEDKFGWWELAKGAYKVKTNETVNMPDNLIAVAFTRTSLLRMGVFTQNGVWDAGFKGKSEFVLVVDNPFGMRLKQNARVAQLVFQPVNKTEEYEGIFKNLK